MPLERRLAEMLSEFARTLVTNFSIQEILDHLVVRIVDVLPISGAGVTLITPGVRPRYVAASGDAAMRFEQLQSELGEGPCLAAYDTGEMVTVPDLRRDRRFPRFRPPALAAGLVAVFTFPLRSGDKPLGALDLYRDSPGALDLDTLDAAQTLADVAAAYLINAQARTDLVESSEEARRSRARDELAVEALRASEARKAAVLASALDAVLTMDQHGNVIEFNPAAERTFGYSSEEAHGRNLASLIIPPGDRDAHERGLQRYLTTGEGPLLGQRTDMLAMRADGSTFPAEISISAVDGPGARFFTGFVRDLTRRVAADAERRSLENRLHQTERLESLGQLAGGVAHDFNNLLTVIWNYASFIAEESASGDAARSHAKLIVDAAEQAARLTRQLLTFAHQERIQQEPIDLKEIVLDIHGLLSRSIGEHVELVIDAEAELPPILAERGQAEQVLLNLAVNARDAMPDGGTLTIETGVIEVDAKHALWLGTLRPGAYVQLSVSDTGTGMSPDVTARAFEPFFTTKVRGEGSGLGLSIVYGIVTDAGGTVSLWSKPGLGTTVTAYFPTSDVPLGAAPEGMSTDVPLGRGQKVLVVEDQPAVREVTVAMLDRCGYTSLEAANGREARAIASDQPFDLLLTDVVMPETSGRELAEELSQRRPGLPVVYMSGYSAGVLGPQRILDPGVSMIRKPFDAATLRRALHRALVDSDDDGGRKPA